ncbi:MAG TPA: mercuric transport protein MerTP [Flavobacteriales bacterium]|nr:mercuric transport protein MerTP [Flavobacteriales bacterium]|tara:strand:+ start:19893 stop:20495 length:603 start_codon:yes stop_codon:yes gene_type:complete
MKKSNNKKLIGAGVLSAIAASLCCITSILAAISGAAGAASVFSWLEPFRPYLIAITFIVLGFAWYQKLKPKSKEDIECACEEDEKPSFWQSKTFLGIVTVFAVLMTAFPHYGDVFYPSNEPKQIVIVNAEKVIDTVFSVEDMTCGSCERHIESEVLNLPGIVSVKADAIKGKVSIQYDKTKINSQELEETINETGYKVKK